jgi:hypothetical protein
MKGSGGGRPSESVEGDDPGEGGGGARLLAEGELRQAREQVRRVQRRAARRAARAPRAQAAGGGGLGARVRREGAEGVGGALGPAARVGPVLLRGADAGVELRAQLLPRNGVVRRAAALALRGRARPWRTESLGEEGCAGGAAASMGVDAACSGLGPGGRWRTESRSSLRMASMAEGPMPPLSWKWSRSSRMGSIRSGKGRRG